MHQSTASFLVCGLLIVLTACGGGSGIGGSDDPGGGEDVLAPGTGRLGPFPIAGLSFETATHAGVTDARGTFTFEPGETIRFFLGDIDIGEPVPAEQHMTIADLFLGLELPFASSPASRRLLDAQVPYERDRFLGGLRPTSVYGRTPAVAMQEAFANTLALLQSLDADKDVANGIQLAEGLRAYFDGRTVELRRTILAFIEDREASLMMHELHDLGHVATARRINPFLALDRFAAAASIVPEVYVIVRWEFTQRGRLVQIRDVSLDALGFVGGEREDRDADGTWDQGPRGLVYDAYGDPVRYIEDDGGDGVPEYEVRYEADVHGLHVSTRLPAQMFYPISERTEYERDTWGRVRIERGYLADALDWSARTEYDLHHQPVFWIRDFDGDGMTDQEGSATHQYDRAGRLRQSSFDDDLDGTFESVHAWHYDLAGYLTAETTDEDADGTWDRVTQYDRDAEGRIREIRHTPGSTTTLDADGNLSSRGSSRYTYDAVGNLTREDRPPGGTTYSYAAELLAESSGSYRECYNADCTDYLECQTETSFTYDAVGNATLPVVRGLVQRDVREAPVLRSHGVPCRLAGTPSVAPVRLARRGGAPVAVLPDADRVDLLEDPHPAESSAFPSPSAVRGASPGCPPSRESVPSIQYGWEYERVRCQSARCLLHHRLACVWSRRLWGPVGHDRVWPHLGDVGCAHADPCRWRCPHHDQRWRLLPGDRDAGPDHLDRHHGDALSRWHERAADDQRHRHLGNDDRHHLAQRGDLRARDDRRDVPCRARQRDLRGCAGWGDRHLRGPDDHQHQQRRDAGHDVPGLHPGAVHGDRHGLRPCRRHGHGPFHEQQRRPGRHAVCGSRDDRRAGHDHVCDDHHRDEPAGDAVAPAWRRRRCVHVARRARRRRCDAARRQLHADGLHERHVRRPGI